MDTLKFCNRLKAKGFSEGQASGVVETVQEVITEYRSANKDDFLQIEKNLHHVEKTLRAEIKASQAEIFKWMIPLLMGLYAVIIFKPLIS